jgi:sulfopropanediol 3-dehydrogenase
MHRYLKTAEREPLASDPEIAKAVAGILAAVEDRGEDAVREFSTRFDNWSPERFTVTDEEIAVAANSIPDELRDYIDRAAENIRAFAEAQRGTLSDLEIEPSPGLMLGHKLVPVASVGAYAPGGRYPLIASSLMTTVVPKSAGVDRVVACAPPSSSGGIAPAMLYAMWRGGADQVICVGGAHGMAALAYGIEGIEPTAMVVGAGNAYVAEAKRQLFGSVGIDLLAGPTEILVVADQSANPELVASDIVGQLEHGPTSAGWLVSTSHKVAEAALAAIERRIDELPTGPVARKAWDCFGEVVVCDSEDEAVELADRFAPEHVEIHTAQPGYYLERMRDYGSMFLGENTAVPYGDKGIGTNHVLPTAGAARYTGGLWVGTFLKALTYQSATVEAGRAIAPMIAAICEAEQLPGHAQSALDRLEGIKARAGS